MPSAGVRGENAVTRPKSKKRTIGKTTRKDPKTARVGARKKPLSALTDQAVRRYLKSLNGHKPADLYQLVMGEVEKPLLKTVMEYTGGNQSQAAEILGINRGTLRKKLKSYKLLGG